MALGWVRILGWRTRSDRCSGAGSGSVGGLMASWCAARVDKKGGRSRPEFSGQKGAPPCPGAQANAGPARRVLATLTARDPHASEHNEGAGELLLREPGGG